LFDALLKVKLIQDRLSCKYTRCGRTDKGVSALGQVISLYLRSNLPLLEDDEDASPQKKRKTEEDDSKKVQEIDYCGLLNKVLPEDIRIIGWNEVSENFSARFSATYRKYRYFFVRRNLNITAMNEAASYLIGDHDFRNLCKMDVVNVTNFRREIYEANIVPFMHNESNNDRSVWMLEIRGIAFLWHMVRCIMAILLLVGEGKEQPTIVKELLDIDNCSSKPLYEMACDQPLVLYECGFENLKLDMQANNLYSLTQHYESIWQRHIISAARAMNALEYIRSINLNTSSVEVFFNFINEKIRRKQNDKNAHYITIDNTMIEEDNTISWKNVYTMIAPHYIEPHKLLMVLLLPLLLLLPLILLLLLPLILSLLLVKIKRTKL
jgi:tRNA pseudouridine38/39 synthase